jgi:circadian clock protein KaiC
MLTRLVDFLKSRGITALFTSLTSGAGSAEMTEVGISSLMDTWFLVRNLESNGERNRGLYVLKSRGMPHSNKIREFVLTNQGARLLDVYAGPAGVLTGTARTVQEAQDKAGMLTARNEIARKQRALASMKDAMEAQIAALQARFAAESSELNTAISEGLLAEKTLAELGKILGSLRMGRESNESSNGKRGAKNGRQYQSGRDNGRKERARVERT